MKKILLLTSVFLTLVGCANNNNTLTLDLEFKTDDTALKSILETKSEKTIERVTFNLEQNIPDISITNKNGKTRMTVKLQKEESIKTLADNLERPLDLFFAREAKEDEKADIENEQFGRFVRTEMTGDKIKWVTAESAENDKGRVIINLTEEGKKVWKKLIDENLGKKIGIFVRGGLISLYVVDKNEMKDSVIIDKIPSLQLANVFADDINVSTYVVFKAQ